jgi:cell division protease FtsH
MDKKVQLHAWYFAAAMIGILLLQQFWAQSQKMTAIPYSEFLDDLKGGKVEEVRVSGSYIEGQWKKPASDKKRYFTTTIVPSDLADNLERYHVRFSGEVQSRVSAAA